MRDVHESNPCTRGKIVGSNSGSIDVYRQIDKRRAVGFLVRRHAQSWNSVLHKSFIAQIVELPLSRYLCQLVLEGRQIERSTNILVELMFDSAIRVRIAAGDFDALHFLQRRTLACSTFVEIALP